MWPPRNLIHRLRQAGRARGGRQLPGASAAGGAAREVGRLPASCRLAVPSCPVLRPLWPAAAGVASGAGCGGCRRARSSAGAAGVGLCVRACLLRKNRRHAGSATRRAAAARARLVRSTPAAPRRPFAVEAGRCAQARSAKVRTMGIEAAQNRCALAASRLPLPQLFLFGGAVVGAGCRTKQHRSSVRFARPNAPTRPLRLCCRRRRRRFSGEALRAQPGTAAPAALLLHLHLPWLPLPPALRLLCQRLRARRAALTAPLAGRHKSYSLRARTKQAQRWQYFCGPSRRQAQQWI